MKRQHLITIRRFCEFYNVPISFINALHEFDLIDLVNFENTIYIHEKHITIIEKMIRMHYELDINMEGVDVIQNLLKQIEALQEQVVTLNNKLKFYEDLHDLHDISHF